MIWHYKYLRATLPEQQNSVLWGVTNKGNAFFFIFFLRAYTNKLGTRMVMNTSKHIHVFSSAATLACMRPHYLLLNTGPREIICLQ